MSILLTKRLLDIRREASNFSGWLAVIEKKGVVPCIEREIGYCLNRLRWNLESQLQGITATERGKSNA